MRVKAMDSRVLRLFPCRRMAWGSLLLFNAFWRAMIEGVLARRGLEKAFFDFIPDLFFDGLSVLHAVDDEEAVWKGTGEDEIAFTNSFVEFDIFLFHAVWEVARAVLNTGYADFCRDVDDDGEVGHEVADGEGVDILNGVAGHSARGALVDGSGVEKAVREDDATFFEGGEDEFADELSSTCSEEEEFSFWAHFMIRVGVF